MPADAFVPSAAKTVYGTLEPSGVVTVTLKSKLASAGYVPSSDVTLLEILIELLSVLVAVRVVSPLPPIASTPSTSMGLTVSVLSS